jgi:WD40 repeat protein
MIGRTALALTLACLLGNHLGAAETDRHGDALPAGAVARLGTVRFHHGDRIDSLAYSPDGKLLASSSLDNTVRIWDAATGREVRRLALGNAAFHIAWSPDGKTLASGGLGNFVRLWDAATGQEQRALEHLDSVNALGFTPDGKHLMTAGVSVRLWNVATGKEVRRFPGGPRLTSAALSPDGRVLAVVGQWQPLVLWDVGTGKEVRRIEVPGNGASCLAFAPDGKVLALCCQDGSVRLFGLADGREVRTLEPAKPGQWSLVFSPDGRWLACSGRKTALRVWETATGKELAGFRDSPERAAAMAFSSDGRLLASAGEGRRIRFWEVPSGKECFPASDERVEPGLLQFGSEGRSLFATGDGQTIEQWQAPGWRRGHRFVPEGRGMGEPAMALSPDGRVVAMRAEEGVVLWDRRTGKQTGRLRGGDGGGRLAFSADGKAIAGPDRHGAVHVWEVVTGRLQRRFVAGSPDGPVFLSPDGRAVVLVGAVDTLSVRKVATGNEVSKLLLVPTASLQGAFLGDDRLLVTGSREGVIQWWRVASEQELRRFPGGKGGVSALAASADGRTVATAHYGTHEPRVIRLWETATGKVRRLFRGHQCEVTNLAFSPDGRLLASSSHDHTALLWDTAGPDWRPDADPPSAAWLAALWAQLASEDAPAAFDAILTLAACPGRGLPLLRKHLRPVPAYDARQVARWVADLDSEEFAVRQRASRELEKLDELAEPALKRAKDSPSAEVRRRVQLLLERLARAEDMPERLRLTRALEALERMDTAESRRLLRDLAAGAPEAWLTREAQGTLRRLERRAAAESP